MFREFRNLTLNCHHHQAPSTRRGTPYPCPSPWAAPRTLNELWPERCYFNSFESHYYYGQYHLPPGEVPLPLLLLLLRENDKLKWIAAADLSSCGRRRRNGPLPLVRPLHFGGCWSVCRSVGSAMELNSARRSVRMEQNLLNELNPTRPGQPASQPAEEGTKFLAAVRST